MNAYQDLCSLYQEWRQFSEAEGEAIRLGEWQAVDDCQTAKYGLQSRIMAATELFQSEISAQGRGPGEFERQFRGIVSELIQLEERNGRWLDDQRQRAHESRNELSRSARNLRQLHRAYAAEANAAWSSYS